MPIGDEGDAEDLHAVEEKGGEDHVATTKSERRGLS